MKMKIALDPGAKMPTRAHKTDAGLDLYANCDKTVYAGFGEFFDTGVHVEIPAGYVGYIKARSGLMKMKITTCCGTIDSGYTGSIGVILFNQSASDYCVKEGDRIAQLVIQPIVTPDLELVDQLDDTERGDGGFGSTGR